MKEKMEMVPGVKVKGYGLLNEYGEFDFIPEQTGSRSGQTKLVKAGQDFTVSTTNKSLIVHMRMDKAGTMLDRLKRYSNLTTEILSIIRDYDF